MEKTLPPIPAKRYFTIGEVGELCGVKPHVLRYWEQEFTQLRPMKRRGNRRYYQHHEVLMIRRIRELLYDQGFTISGARNQLGDLAPRAGASGPACNSGRSLRPLTGEDVFKHVIRGQYGAGAINGKRVAAFFYPGFNQLLDAQAAVVVAGGVIEFDQQVLAVACTEQLEAEQRGFRLCEDAVKEDAEAVGHAGNTGALEQGTVVAPLDVDALADLSERGHAAGVLPYYLHQLDRVAGVAHFEVDDARARALHAGLAARLSGYLVPRLVREIPGDTGKRPL